MSMGATQMSATAIAVAVQLGVVQIRDTKLNIVFVALRLLEIIMWLKGQVMVVESVRHAKGYLASLQ